MGDGRIKLDVLGAGRSGSGREGGGYGSTGGNEISSSTLISTTSSEDDLMPVSLTSIRNISFFKITLFSSSQTSLYLFRKG